MKKFRLAVALTLSLAFSTALLAPTTYAGTNSVGGGSSQSTCGDTKTQLVACDKGTKTGIGAINSLISTTLTILSVLVGVVAVGGLAYAGVLYATSADNANQVDSAKTIIRNIVIGLLMYVFTIAIVNWLVPGGVISGGGGNDGTTTNPDGTPAQQQNSGSSNTSST